MARKMTNYEMVQILNNLKLFENKKLPQKISYAIVKNIMALTKEYDVYIKQLEKLINEAKKNEKLELTENGQIIETENHIPKVKDEYKEEFNDDLEDLLLFYLDVDYSYVDESIFDYDEKDKYDVLSPAEVFALRTCLCEN